MDEPDKGELDALRATIVMDEAWGDAGRWEQAGQGQLARRGAPSWVLTETPAP